MLTFSVLPDLQYDFFNNDKTKIFLVAGVTNSLQGLLSFITTPFLGAVSDAWGRKIICALTGLMAASNVAVLFTPNLWYYFAVFVGTGCLGVAQSNGSLGISNAYIADVTNIEERSVWIGRAIAALGLSLIVAPPLGGWLDQRFGYWIVFAISVGILTLNTAYCLFILPESLQREHRKSFLSNSFNPFRSLKYVAANRMIFVCCVITFWANLSESGVVAILLLYFKQKPLQFTAFESALYLSGFGLVSVIIQAVLFKPILKLLGPRKTVYLGLSFNFIHDVLYGVVWKLWMVYAMFTVAAFTFLTPPALYYIVSTHANPDNQGVMLGALSGVRSLSGGIGPLLFGLMVTWQAQPHSPIQNYRGAPFFLGALFVMTALIAACFLPDKVEKEHEIDTEHTRIQEQDRLLA